MIRRIFAVLALMACPGLAFGQVTKITPAGGGGVASGSAISGCTAFSIVYIDTSGNLACASTPINGSVTTAGRSILTIRDTITGASATSNFLNVTGSFNSTLSAETVGSLFSYAADNDSQTQSALKTIVSGSGPAVDVSIGVYSTNTANGDRGYGVLGYAAGTATTNVGVAGAVANATNNIAGWFRLGLGTPPATTAALVSDNGPVAANIFEARDNGTPVFVVADGGYIQGTRGEVSLNADYTNATASFTSTALSVDVVSGRTYAFQLVAFFSDSTAADGAQFDFNGGAATMTNFRVHCTAANNAGAALVITNAASTALATAVQVALALTSQTVITCNGTMVPSSSSTFIVRAAQTAHSTGTLTVNRGSWLSVKDSRPL